MDYHTTIKTLFSLLAQANASDSDAVGGRQPWQHVNDCLHRTQWGLGYYGYLQEAIETIAGRDIVEHWAETNEIDLDLANRNPALGVA